MDILTINSKRLKPILVKGSSCQYAKPTRKSNVTSNAFGTWLYILVESNHSTLKTGASSSARPYYRLFQNMQISNSSCRTVYTIKVYVFFNNKRRLSRLTTWLGCVFEELELSGVGTIYSQIRRSQIKKSEAKRCLNTNYASFQP